MIGRIGAGLALMLLAQPLAAQVDVTAAESCFEQMSATPGEAQRCVEAAQAECGLSMAEAPAAATLCYGEARAAWSEALAQRVASFTAELDENLAAVARIETKYDLLSNLLQCDRTEELSRAVSELTGPQIQVQVARCQSTAAGLAYMLLYLRTRPNL